MGPPLCNNLTTDVSYYYYTNYFHFFKGGFEKIFKTVFYNPAS